jgi:predicted metal-dependent TIM-barrel fold hydrolase
VLDVFIDSHTHLTELTIQNLEDMYLAGIRTVVSPVMFPSVVPVSSQTIQDVWDVQLDYQLHRAGEQLIKAYAMICVTMVSIPKDPENLLKILPDYLDNPKVVAIGEIGFEPSSETCGDLTIQEQIVKAQLKMALEKDMPVVFHVPNPPELKEKFTARSLQLAEDAGLSMKRVLIDHCNEVNIEMVLQKGAFAGISVQPWRNMTPELAADMVFKFGPDNIVINSDCSTEPSDPLAVARTSYALARKGASDIVIEKVCHNNSKGFYGI